MGYKVLRRKIIMSSTNLTGKPSVDRPWLQYYPEPLRKITVPECTVKEYLKMNCPGEDVAAMDFYGSQILWGTVFQKTEAVARSMRAVGFKEGDQIPVFLSSVPEFIYILLAAEQIGASLLCRDNTLKENVEAVRKSGAKVIIAQDYLAQHELGRFLSDTDVEKVVLIDACQSCRREDMPDYVRKNLDSRYPDEKAHGPKTMDWEEFLAIGESYKGPVDAPVDVNRPLFRAYTSGSTGPSKQVIHSAHTMLAVIAQMNFYAGASDYRPTWMVTALPPALVAVVVAMELMPLASNKLLILNPYVAVEDVDLELMRCRPNSWPLIPMFIETVMRNGRIPDDYDLSHLTAAGAGSESYNNNQLKRAQKFVDSHNCHIRFTTGYGNSEAGSNVTLPMSPYPMGNGNVGVPTILNVISVFEPGTQKELTYNEMGEICISGPGLMLGYDNEEATKKALQVHEDGMTWLHTGDIGFMNEDGVLYVQTRGKAPRYGGGDLATLPMENRLADADIKGIDDEFFVVVPDSEHVGCFLPYLYVVLEDGYTIDDIEDKVRECLDDYMQPVEIIELSERPFFHFKTNRIGLTKMILKEQLKKVPGELRRANA